MSEALPLFAAAFPARPIQMSHEGQRGRVVAIIADGQWRTLFEIAHQCRYRFGKTDSEAAISARLRDLRKVQYGQHVVERRKRSAGTYEYRCLTIQEAK